MLVSYYYLKAVNFCELFKSCSKKKRIGGMGLELGL